MASVGHLRNYKLTDGATVRLNDFGGYERFKCLEVLIVLEFMNFGGCDLGRYERRL